MEMRTLRIETTSRGEADMVDLTDDLAGIVREQALEEGQALVFVTGGESGRPHEPMLRVAMPAHDLRGRV